MTGKEAADLDPAFQDFSQGFLLLQLESPLRDAGGAGAVGLLVAERLASGKGRSRSRRSQDTKCSEGNAVRSRPASVSRARRREVTTILDPAPAAALPPALLRNLDFLTPNETEALLLLGHPPGQIRLEEAPALGPRRLLELGPATVVLKLGDKGAWVVNRRRRLSRHFPAFPVKAADATAAGDTFNGALAVSLAEGRPLPQAIGFANAAAALSVTRPGAQASIPSRSQVDRFISEHRG